MADSRVALLDVNVLVALFDPGHVHHEAAHTWFRSNRANGWATCAITENGFVRVVSNPRYPGRRSSCTEAARRLGRLCRTTGHVFWRDSISFLDEELFAYRHVGGHRRVTDTWLLALARRNEGYLVTFDRGIPLAAVTGAEPRNLRVI